MDETKKLVQFVTGLQYQDVDNEVLETTKYLILDQLGCQISFAGTPVSRAVYKYIRARKGANAESVVAFYGLRTTVEDAAFANAIFGHGFEMDDTELRTTSHPGVAVIPAALAAGETAIVTGREFLTAVIAGYDVMLRVGMAAGRMINRSFHTTGVTGTFGSVAATGKIWDFDDEEMINALGIAGSDCGGIGEYTVSGGNVKRLHAGFAAQSGVRAALLSKAGITGPPTVLEGKKGVCQAYSDEYDTKEITADFGRPFRILWTGTKPYCCCAAQHTALDAAEAIKVNTSVDPNDIESITITQRPREVQNVGNIIEPKDVVSAQFSGRFGVAMRLIRGSNGFHDYSMANVNDPAILNLAKKADYLEQPFDDVPPGSAPARVTVRTKGGSVFEEQVNYAKGTVQNPMSKQELIIKFKELVSHVLSETHAEKIIRTVMNLEHIDNIIELSSLLSVRGGDQD